MSLPAGWGITKFPCTKLTPLDCFKEGGSFDYPAEMKLLEMPVPDVGTNTGLSLIDLIVGFAQMTTAPVHCFKLLEINITSQFTAAKIPTATIPFVSVSQLL